jgi:hypothetical protein
MKVRAIILTILISYTIIAAMYLISLQSEGQTVLVNDIPIEESAPVPDEYQFTVMEENYTVIGIRPETGDDFDLEIFTDTTFTTLIESSTAGGDVVDFVVLERDLWTSPPNRGARVTSGTTTYVIEMENEIDNYTIMDTWSGSIDFSPGNPVITTSPTGWDERYVTHPSVIYDGEIYHMWYSGRDNANHYRIGYANSSDGVTWEKYLGNPILDIGPGAWEDDTVTHPSVIYDGNTYHMWYSGYDGFNYQIGYANSSNGITWNKYAMNPVLDLGGPTTWEDTHVFGCSVLFDGVKFHMWYTGYDGSNYRIGYANSSEGITWDRYAGNPVFNIGTFGSWDDYHVSAPTIIYD